LRQIETFIGHAGLFAALQRHDQSGPYTLLQDKTIRSDL
jgi:hypothetical protein